MIPGEFEYQQDLQSKVASCPNLRTMIDTVPESELFISPFLTIDLLRASRQPLPKNTRKIILQNALTGLAELHDNGIVHTGKYYTMVTRCCKCSDQATRKVITSWQISNPKISFLIIRRTLVTSPASKTFKFRTWKMQYSSNQVRT